MKRTKAQPAIEPVEAVAIDAAAYWHLRTRLAEHQALQAQVVESRRQIDQVMAACGLNPATNYRLDDMTLTAVEQK